MTTMDTPNTKSAPVESRSAPSRSFRESTIAFAVDTSGSTEGAALAAESEAIMRVAVLLPRERQSNVMVLPWNDRCETPVRLYGLNQLRSDGGTDPAVLFNTPENRMILSEAHFWFLMTDGLIYPPEVRDFASKITTHGMHGKACVITIFGYRDGLPAQCNISVGLSVFATSPHVTFLFYDLGSGRLYILGVKGCFTELLRPGEKSPNLDMTSRWEHLPLTSFENLTRVSVPPPQAVKKDDIILEGGRVNLNELFSQTEVQQTMLEQIIDNPQNQQSISIAAKAMGRTQELNAWLDRVDHKIDISMTNNRPNEVDDTGESAASIDQIIADLMSQSLDSRTKNEAQRRLSQANESWERARRSIEAQKTSLSHTRRSSTGAMRRLSIAGLDTAANNLNYVTPISGPTMFDTPSLSAKLMNPGFFHPGKNGDCVRGICMLCAKPDTILCLHLVKPPTSLKTRGLPEPNTQTRLRYPLAMGNFPEMDIISSFFSCDPCAARLLRKPRKTRHGETIVANLPLVACNAANREAWIETLSLATERRFCADDLPAVFLAILSTKLERFPSEQGRKSLPRYILDWCCRMLLRDGDASVFDSDDNDGNDGSMDAHTSTAGTTTKWMHRTRSFAGCRIPILEGLRHDFNTATMATQKPNSLVTYPLDGFIVANVVVSNSMLKTAVSQERRRTIVWVRFLYRLAETYHDYHTRGSSLHIDAATSLLLLQPSSSQPGNNPTTGNLFRLENMRLFTIYKARSKPPPDNDGSQQSSSSEAKSTVDFFRSIGALLTTRAQRFRLALRPTPDDMLASSPFLNAHDLADFERLGPLFSWIADEAGHALALFLNWLLRVNRADDVDGKGRRKDWDSMEDDSEASTGTGSTRSSDFASPEERFSWLRRHPSLRLVFEDPRAVSPKSVEEGIKDLPPLRH